MSHDSAWLAGLWDGEGSVGVTNSRSTGRLVYIPTIQINMTHQATVQRAADILYTRLGCVIRLHEVRPHDMTMHKVSYYFAVRRTVWLAGIAADLATHSTTKRKHWELLAELCHERLTRCGKTADGGLFRGGAADTRAPYSQREHDLVAELREANAYANNRSRTRMEAGAA